LQTDDLNNSLNADYEVLDDEDFEEQGLVPWVAIIVVSILPLPLMFFDFQTLIMMDGFLMIFNMFLQIWFYVYARHGKFGHYSRHPPDGTTFYIHGSGWMTLAMVATPLIVSIALMITNGWMGVVIFIIV
jgi:hypothetical protein